MDNVSSKAASVPTHSIQEQEMLQARMLKAIPPLTKVNYHQGQNCLETFGSDDQLNYHLLLKTNKVPDARRLHALTHWIVPLIVNGQVSIYKVAEDSRSLAVVLEIDL